MNAIVECKSCLNMEKKLAHLIIENRLMEEEIAELKRKNELLLEVAESAKLYDFDEHGWKDGGWNLEDSLKKAKEGGAI